MSKDAMKTVLFVTFIGIMLITVMLSAYATIMAVDRPDAQLLWDFVRFTWMGVLLEITAFLIALAYDLFGFQASKRAQNELAREIAAKWAQEIVANSNGDPTALNTSYWETKEEFPFHFRSQGKAWLIILDEEFKVETVRQARLFSSINVWERLRGWEPKAEAPDLGPVELSPVFETA